MPNLLESRYRDYLADHLDLIEHGLTLVEAEMFLPNSDGARGFIDLVARDRFGVVVLIELKRSDSAARSAMHELFKYMALFRQNHGLGKHQLRCILISTTWHELLVPFSELLASAPFELTGRVLVIGIGGDPSATLDIVPIENVDAIAICPKHDVLLYESCDSRSDDIERVATALADAGVSDYFLIHLDHDGSNARVITPYSLYVVLGEFSSDQRIAIHKAQKLRLRDGDDADEYEYESISGDADDDEEELEASSWDHEEVVFLWLNASTQARDIEIGYPDKLRLVLGSWLPTAFTRAGRFSSKLAWPDNTLLAGAVSEGGQHTNVFDSQVSTSNQTAYARMLSNVQYSLQGAKGWQKQLPRLLKHVRSETAASAVSIHLFSPCDLIWSLAALANGNVDYLPAFEIVVESPDDGTRIFLGSLEWDTETILSPDIKVEDVVPGGSVHYLLGHHFGTQWQDENRYCKMHGLRYVIYEVALQSPNEQFWRIRVRSSGLTKVPLTLDDLRARSVYAFAENHSRYLDRLSKELIKDHATGLPF